MRQRVLGLLVVTLAVSPSGAAGESARKPGRPPNVLFIAVDDLNAWVSCIGAHPQIKTPHIDRLAARGTLFTRAYCAAPACNPSRAALLSGRRPSSTGIYHNNQPWQPVLKDVLTLPRHFKDSGYRVAGGGKIFHGQGADPRHWDDYFRRPGDPRPKVASVSGLNRAQFDWGPVEAGDEAMGDHKLVSWASEQLGKKHDRPLFLAVGFVKPHLPWYVPKKYFDRFPLSSVELPKVLADDLADVPPGGVRMAGPGGDHRAVVKAGQWKHAVQGYLASITFVDGQVGRLLDALDRSAIKDDTVVVFWGDHGWHLGEKEHWRKFALWEEATRAPLIVAAPGAGKPGNRCDAPVDFMGIYPTLADLCGLAVPKHVEGESLRPLLVDGAAKWERPAITTHGRGNHAVRLGPWRYVRYADGGEELYDHRDDPREWKNLAKDEKHAEVKRRLAKCLPEKEAPDAPRAARR